MTVQTAQQIAAGAWALVRGQHGVITRQQLLARGFTPHAIDHRISKGRLHPVYPGVYAVGRPQLTRHGHFMAAVLHAGETAALSHSAAAELWGIIERGTIEVSVLSPRGRKGVHRRKAFETTTRHGIPVTTPICTIVDITTRLTEEALERALGEADKLDLIHPARLRKALDKMSGRPGVGRLKATLDRQTFVLTHSELERLFVPIALRAGCCRPLSQRVVNGERVDFYFPDHDAIVETDGGRYHRTAAQQLKDRRRDQKHYLADVLPLRFTHWQIAHAAREEVEPVLRKLSTRRSRGPSSGRGDPTPPSASGAAAARTQAA